MPDQGQRRLHEAIEEATGGFPGTWEYALDVLRDVPYPDAPWTEKRPDQRDLAWIRRRLGGNEGHLTDPNGAGHFVSLVQWADDSPDTPCCFHWTFVPDPTVSEEWERFCADRLKDRHDDLRHDRCWIEPRGRAGHLIPGQQED